jgi:hypothetical protein
LHSNAFAADVLRSMHLFVLTSNSKYGIALLGKKNHPPPYSYTPGGGTFVKESFRKESLPPHSILSAFGKIMAKNKKPSRRREKMGDSKSKLETTQEMERRKGKEQMTGCWNGVAPTQTKMILSWKLVWQKKKARNGKKVAEGG